jgi:hypothetical protein
MPIKPLLDAISALYAAFIGIVIATMGVLAKISDFAGRSAIPSAKPITDPGPRVEKPVIGLDSEASPDVMITALLGELPGI